MDEQKLEEIGIALQLAKKDDLTLEIQHHNGFDYTNTKVKVAFFDPLNQSMRCINQSDSLLGLLL
ncbi:YolD-like family protein [Halobacillus sp. KCTC 3957]|uniref:YolD-like family protein n=1 Tax=Halobacillus yeomjeoni TaxID=311194 RepID=A0A931HVD4_9BACI|nr:YolD-like family protein [Halobacillus yeomjeoni]